MATLAIVVPLGSEYAADTAPPRQLDRSDAADALCHACDSSCGTTEPLRTK
jgi:hypothetical protein